MKIMKNYWSPTPVKMRKLGDALLAVSLSSGIPASMMDYKWTAITFFVCGIVGKFLTNLYKEEK